MFKRMYHGRPWRHRIAATLLLVSIFIWTPFVLLSFWLEDEV